MLKEAQILARLDHPNITQINDYGEFGHIPYLVLERLDGDSLAQKPADTQQQPCS